MVWGEGHWAGGAWACSEQAMASSATHAHPHLVGAEPRYSVQGAPLCQCVHVCSHEYAIIDLYTDTSCTASPPPPTPSPTPESSHPT